MYCFLYVTMIMLGGPGALLRGILHAFVFILEPSCGVFAIQILLFIDVLKSNEILHVTKSIIFKIVSHSHIGVGGDNGNSYK